MLITEKKGDRIYSATLPRGDNGELEIIINGYELTKNDKIVFRLGKDINKPSVEKIVTDFFENSLSISLLPKDTQHLPQGQYYFLVKLIKSYGEVDTIIEKSDFILEDA